MRPRVLLDVTRSVGRRWRGRTASGIDRVCDAYAEHLGESAHAVLQIRGNALVLDDAASRALFTVLDAPTQVFRREFTRLIVNPARSASCLPAVGDAFYLNVGHSGFDANAHWNWIARQGLSPLYLLHDLIPITHPHVTTPRKTARHRERVVRALSGGTGLIANSYATADALRDFAASENLPLPPLLVAPIAASLPSARAPVADQERPLFVSVGTIEKRKNHILLLQVWTLLIARMGEAAPRLVIAGNWGKGGGPVREALRRDPRLARFVEIRCGLDDNQIADLVAGARAALLPTSAEGFGMPLIEALSLEVPVIANDLPSLREIGQDIPHFLDGDDPAAWAAAIAEMCGDGPDRPRQLAMMRQFRAPSWSAHFAALDLWMKDLRRSARPATTLRLDHAGMRSDPTNYRSAGRPPIPGREASC